MDAQLEASRPAVPRGVGIWRVAHYLRWWKGNAQLQRLVRNGAIELQNGKNISLVDDIIAAQYVKSMYRSVFGIWSARTQYPAVRISRKFLLERAVLQLAFRKLDLVWRDWRAAVARSHTRKNHETAAITLHNRTRKASTKLCLSAWRISTRLSAKAVQMVNSAESAHAVREGDLADEIAGRLQTSVAQHAGKRRSIHLLVGVFAAWVATARAGHVHARVTSASAEFALSKLASRAQQHALRCWQHAAYRARVVAKALGGIASSKAARMFRAWVLWTAREHSEHFQTEQSQLMEDLMQANAEALQSLAKLRYRQAALSYRRRSLHRAYVSWQRYRLAH
jgi:hypothetical protein